MGETARVGRLNCWVNRRCRCRPRNCASRRAERRTRGGLISARFWQAWVAWRVTWGWRSTTWRRRLRLFLCRRGPGDWEEEEEEEARQSGGSERARRRRRACQASWRRSIKPRQGPPAPIPPEAAGEGASGVASAAASLTAASGRRLAPPPRVAPDPLVRTPPAVPWRCPLSPPHPGAASSRGLGRRASPNTISPRRCQTSPWRGRGAGWNSVDPSWLERRLLSKKVKTRN